MFDAEKVKELQLRKQALLIESELNRRALQAEVGEFKNSFSWFSEGWEMFSVLKPFWMVMAPFAGFSIARKWSKATSRWRKGILIAGLLRKGWQAVQNARRLAR